MAKDPDGLVAAPVDPEEPEPDEPELDDPEPEDPPDPEGREVVVVTAAAAAVVVVAEGWVVVVALGWVVVGVVSPEKMIGAVAPSLLMSPKVRVHVTPAASWAGVGGHG